MLLPAINWNKNEILRKYVVMLYRCLCRFNLNVGRCTIYLTTQSHIAKKNWCPLFLKGQVSLKNSTPTWDKTQYIDYGSQRLMLLWYLPVILLWYLTVILLWFLTVMLLWCITAIYCETHRVTNRSCEQNYRYASSQAAPTGYVTPSVLQNAGRLNFGAG
jgi:hypothetical protein